MTIEERDTARAIQTLAKHADGVKVNWEQRRYEIAKSALTGLLTHRGDVNSVDFLTDKAIAFADSLIAKLKG